jgi:hypothetical protein
MSCTLRARSQSPASFRRGKISFQARENRHIAEETDFEHTRHREVACGAQRAAYQFTWSSVMFVSQCAACGAIVPQYDTVNTVSGGHGDRLLCTACFNREMAHHTGLDDFGEVKFKSVSLSDANDTVHEFHFQSLLLGEKLSLVAFDSASEEEPSGYCFQILGEPLSNQFVLLGKLIEKMRRMLPNTHVRDSDLGLQIVDKTVRGRIEWDGIEDSRRPCVIIDGRRVEWDKLGRMLMPF